MPRFALETGEPIRISRERARQQLDGDIATQPRIAGPIDLTHSAGAEPLLQLVRADPTPGQG